MILKVYNWKSGVNETKYLVEKEWWECKCGLNESVCNSFQRKEIKINVNVATKN